MQRRPRPPSSSSCRSRRSAPVRPARPWAIWAGPAWSSARTIPATDLHRLHQHGQPKARSSPSSPTRSCRAPSPPGPTPSSSSTRPRSTRKWAARSADHGVITHGETAEFTVTDVQKNKGGKYHALRQARLRLAVRRRYRHGFDRRKAPQGHHARPLRHAPARTTRCAPSSATMSIRPALSSSRIVCALTSPTSPPSRPTSWSRSAVMVSELDARRACDVETDGNADRRGQEAGRHGPVRRKIRRRGPRRQHGRQVHRALRRHARRQYRQGRPVPHHERIVRCLRRPPHRGRHGRSLPEPRRRDERPLWSRLPKCSRPPRWSSSTRPRAA